MMTKFVFGCDAQFACVSAISALLAVRPEFDRHVVACAVERVTGGIAIYSSVAAWFELIRWSEAG